MFWCFLFFCPHVGSVKNTPLFSWAVGYGLVDFWAVFFFIIIICRLTVKLDHISKRKEPLYTVMVSAAFYFSLIVTEQNATLVLH